MQMKKVFLYLVSISLISVLFTGCEMFEDDEDTGLQPGDTVVGSNVNDPSIWRDSDNISPQMMEGGRLEPRDTTFNMMNAGIDGQDKVLASIQFGFDEFTVSGAERGKLDQVVNYMNNNPNAKVVAEGHTDWYGTTEYNLGLGDRRANAVKDYLVRQGISPTRVEVLSLGELEADPDLPKTDPNVIDDRRVDVILVN